MRFLLAILWGCCILAQAPTCRLEGLILDPSGSSAPGANVVAENTTTALRVSTASNSRGFFALFSLLPGEYTVTVDAPGFRKAVVTGIRLGVAATANHTIRLEVGAVTDTVTVKANEAFVQAADAQGSHLVSMREVNALPQLERYPITLALFQPGVQIAGGNLTNSRVNGTRRGSNVVKLDGIDASEPWAPSLLWSLFATTDSTQEFRMITHGAKAEYGRSAGAQIEMVTRSGTNRWSGNGYNHLRNTALNANDFFNNSTQERLPRPKYIQNTFGASLGGPLIQNRTFLFANYQGNRLRQEFVRNRVVPTPSARAGIFRWIPDNSTEVQSFDIIRNDPRGLGIDPRIAEHIRLLPSPNNYDLGDGLNTGAFRFNNPGKLRLDQFTVRADHQMTQKVRLFFRLSWGGASVTDSLTNNDAPFPGQPSGALKPGIASYSLGTDWTINARMVNELRFGFQRQRVDRTTARLRESMLVTSLWTPPLNPNFKMDNATSLHEFTNNLSLLRGSQVLKTGVDLYFTRATTSNEAGIYPNVYFDRSYGNIPPDTIGPPAGLMRASNRQRFEGLYNHLLGRMSHVTQTFYGNLESFQPAGTPRVRDFRFRESSYFFQDDWKLRPNLTLNFGLRYELDTPPWEQNRVQGTVDRAGQISRSSRIADLTMQRSARWYRGDCNNFAPRSGLAWAPGRDGKTAIRAHYGIFFERPVAALTNLADNFSPGFSAFAFESPNETQGSDRRVSDSQGIPIPEQPVTPVLKPPNARREIIGLFNPNLRTGYVQQYGLSIQRELLPNTVVEIGFVGNRGVKLLLPVNMNQLRIRDDFLGAFREIQAFRSYGTAVPPGNTLVRIFGSPGQAIARIGGQLFDEGSAGAAADRLDTTFPNLYPGAGLSDFYLRNFPQFAAVVVATNEGRSYYDSLHVSLRRQSGALRFAANYTFSKTIDIGSGNGQFAERPLDSFNLRTNRARGDFDRPHVLNGSLVYRLPTGKGYRINSTLTRWLNSALSNWDLGVLVIWESGAPFSVFSGRKTLVGDIDSYADYAGDRNIGGVQRRDGGVFWFTPEEIARFSAPSAGGIGSSGRNAFRGPRWFNIDLSMAKNFRLGERQMVTFRGEAYNLLNKPVDNRPSAGHTTLIEPGSDTNSLDADLAHLDAGERDAILLAEELAADQIVIDESTLGVLAAGAEQGLVHLRIALDRLRQTSFYISFEVPDRLIGGK